MQESQRSTHGVQFVQHRILMSTLVERRCKWSGNLYTAHVYGVGNYTLCQKHGPVKSSQPRLQTAASITTSTIIIQNRQV